MAQKFPTMPEVDEHHLLKVNFKTIGLKIIVKSQWIPIATHGNSFWIFQECFIGERGMK